MKKAATTLIAMALLAIATVDFPAETASATDYYPAPESWGGWRRLVSANITPSASRKSRIRTTAGLDWEILEQAWEATARYGGSFLVIRNGWVAAEWGTTDRMAMASCTKTMTALAVQRLFDMSAAGSFATTIGPDDLASRYLPSSWGEHPVRQTVSIRHLLNMSSGLEPDDDPPSPTRDTAAYEQKLLDPPVRTEPGLEWSYASLPVDTLSLVTARVTGLRLGDFFQQQIGDPIGVRTMRWAELGSHSYASAYGEITARDLARVAYLMLRRGSWNGRSIISESRIDEMTGWDAALGSTIYGHQVKFPTDPESHLRYGHLVWTNRTQSSYVGAGVPADAYYCAGFRTSFAVTIPSLDLIFVRLQNGPKPWSDDVFTLVTTKVMEAVVPQQ